MIKAGAGVLFARSFKREIVPKENCPLPRFYPPYSTTSFTIYCVVLLMVEMHSNNNKKMAQKKAQQRANASTIVLEKIFEFYY